MSLRFQRNRKKTIKRYVDARDKRGGLVLWGKNQRLSKKKHKENKRILLQNKKLCKRYPWLIIDGYYDCIELDCMPRGWRKAFGDLWCEDVDREIRMGHLLEGVYPFKVLQLKEKYGQFRQYFSISTKELERIISNYETISEYVCVWCGKLDSPIINNHGWYEPLCRKCYEKWVKNNSEYFTPSSYKERLEEAEITCIEDVKIAEQYTVRSYNAVTGYVDKTIDISDLVTRIRYKNRKRKSNIEDVKDLF